jgi:sulfate permease, SulP family
LFIPSIAMTLLAVAEAVSIAQALARKRVEAFNGNQEFIRQGLANTVGSFFSAYPSSGSFNRSGMNVALGAATPFSAICAVLFLVLILSLWRRLRSICRWLQWRRYYFWLHGI